MANQAGYLNWDGKTAQRIVDVLLEKCRLIQADNLQVLHVLKQ